MLPPGRKRRKAITLPSIGTYRKIARKISGRMAKVYSGQSRRSARFHPPGRRLGAGGRGAGSCAATSWVSAMVMSSPPPQSPWSRSPGPLFEALARAVEELEITGKTGRVELAEEGVPLAHVALAHDALQGRGVHRVLGRGREERGLLELALVERRRRVGVTGRADGEHVVDVLDERVGAVGLLERPGLGGLRGEGRVAEVHLDVGLAVGVDRVVVEAELGLQLDGAVVRLGEVDVLLAPAQHVPRLRVEVQPVHELQGGQEVLRLGDLRAEHEAVPEVARLDVLARRAGGRWDEGDVVVALTDRLVQRLRELDRGAGGARGREAGLVRELLVDARRAAAVVGGGEGLAVQQALLDQGAEELDALLVLVGGRRVDVLAAVVDHAVAESPAGL